MTGERVDARRRTGCRARSRKGVAALVAVAGVFGTLAGGGGAAAAPAAPRVQAVEAAVPEAGGGRYHGLTPARLLDTRIVGSPVVGGTPIELGVVGVGGVPATGVDAVVLNVTGTEPSQPSYVTVFPAGGSAPLASSVNFAGGETVANGVIAKVGAEGEVAIRLGHGQADVVVDVQGWFGDGPAGTAAGSPHHALTPARLLDTRSTDSIAAATPLELGVLGVGGVPATGVEAVVVNVTVTEPSQPSFVSVYPAGGEVPLASSVNFAGGETVANSVIAKVGADGEIAIRLGHGRAHVVVDVQGWFGDGPAGTPAGAEFHALAPARLVDTRTGDGALAGATSIDVDVAGQGGVPAAGVTAAVLNVTVTGASQASYVTVFPSGAERPLASNVNFVAGDTVANSAIAKLGDDGQVAVFLGHGTAHVVVDVLGWFGPASPGDGDDDGDGNIDPPTQAVEWEVDGAGWRFVPGQFLLAPGESRLIELVHSDAAGADTEVAVPGGATVGVRGVGVIAEFAGGNTVRVTAGDEVATATVVAGVPGFAPMVSSTATVARLQPGVVTLDDADVVFPEPNLPADADPAVVRGRDVSEAGVGPFTWDEIVARTNLPADGNPLAGLTSEEAADTEFWYPLVVRGAAPAAGAVVVGSGGSGVAGVVLDLAGAPSLERGGMSLLAVRLAAFTEVYYDLAASGSYADLADAGVYPESFSDVAVDGSAADVAVGAAVATAALAGDLHLQADPGTPDPSTPPTTPDPGTPAAPTPPSPPAQPATPPPPNVTTTANSPAGVTPPKQSGLLTNGCKTQPGFGQLLQFNPNLNVTFTPILSYLLDVREGELNRARLELGGSVAITVSLSIGLSLSITVPIECELGRLPKIEIPVPGVLAPVLSAISLLQQKATMEVTVTGGPRLDIVLGCAKEFTAKAGFDYDGATGQTTDLSGLENPPFHCQDVSKFATTTGVSTEGVALKVDAKMALPAEHVVGIKAGGKVAGAIGRYLAWVGALADGDSLGELKLLTNSLGPTLSGTWENSISTFRNEQAQSGAKISVDMESSIEFTGVSWVLKIFGAGKWSGNDLERSFKFTWGNLSVPLATLYAPLSVNRDHVTARGGRSGNDELGLSPAIYVEKGDHFTLRIPMAPSLAGVSSNDSFSELTGGEVYELVSGSEDDTFTVTAVPSTGAESIYGTTTLELKAVIGADTCAALADPFEFKVVGNAPMNIGIPIDTPAWGGRYTVQCVEGKVKFDPDELAEVTVGSQHDVDIVTHGARDDTWKLSGVPSWLELGTADESIEGDITGTPEHPDEDVTIPLRLSVPVPEDSTHCWDPHPPATILVETEHRGAAELKVTESDPCVIELAEHGTTTPVTNVEGPNATIDLRTRGREFDTITFQVEGGADWVHLSPDSNPVAASTTMTVHPITVTTDTRQPSCTVQLPRTVTVKAVSEHRGEATFTVTQPKVDQLPGCGFTFTPNHLTLANGAVATSDLHLLADGLPADVAADWEIDELDVPAWLIVLPLAGALHNDSGATVAFRARLATFDRCSGLTRRTATVTAHAHWIEATGDGPVDRDMDASITIERAAIPPDADCPKPKTGGAGGDPHMVSMDGLRYDAQVHGEFWYSRPSAAALAGTGVELQARHEYTAGGDEETTSASIWPTSVTAFAMRADGHTLEGYMRPEEPRAWPLPPLILVDGAEVALEVGVPYAVTPDFSVVRNPSGYVATFGSTTVEALGSVAGGIFDLYISMPTGTPSVGLLGSPDGDPDNDLAWPDTTLTPLTVATARTGNQEFVDWADAWRITDRADSLFTETYDGFDFDNTPFGDDNLAPYLDAATDYLAELEPVCGVPEIDSDDHTYLVKAVAIEMLLGTPLQQIGHYTCGYYVHGSVTSEVAGEAGGAVLPLAGIRVALAAPGLTGCTVISDSNGNYGCTLRPDFARLADGTGAPVEIPIVARWADDGDVIATATAEFELLAPLGSGVADRTIDLDVPASAFPRAELSGTLLGAAEAPLAGPVTIGVEARAGAFVLGYTERAVIPDPETGEYAFVQALPFGTTSVVAVAKVGVNPSDWTSVTVAGIHAGANTVGLDVSYVPATLRVHGSMFDLDGPIDGPVTIAVQGVAGSTPFDVRPNTVTPDPDGSYTTDFVLPLNATSVVATAQVGVLSGDWVSSPSTPVVQGQLNDLLLNADYRPPILHVSGDLTYADGSPLGATLLEIATYNAADQILHLGYWGVTPDANGHYETTVLTASSTARVRIVARIGLVPSDFVALELSTSADPPTLHTGVNEVTLNAQFAPAVARVSGTFTDADGVGLDEAYVRVVAFDAANTQLGTWERRVEPGADGSYTIDVPLPEATDHVEVRTVYDGLTPVLATQGGFAPGTTVAVHASGIYDPPRITVTGAVTLDGAPYTGPISVWLRQRDADGVQTSYLALSTTATAGAYMFDRTLLNVSRGAELELQLTNGSVQRFELDLDGLALGEHRAVVFDIADARTTLTVQGLWQMFGRAADQGRLTFTFYDAGDQWISWANDVVTFEPNQFNSSYAATLTVPSTATYVYVNGQATSTDDGREWTWDNQNVGERFDLHTGVANQATLSTDVSLVRLSGHVTGPDSEPLTEFDLGYNDYNWAGDTLSWGGSNSTWVDGEGNFTIEALVPTDISRIDYVTTNPDLPGRSTAVALAGAAVYEPTWDVDFSETGRQVEIAGRLSDHGNAVADATITVTVRSYDFDPVEFAADPPYAQSAVRVFTDVPVEDGDWSVLADLPADESELVAVDVSTPLDMDQDLPNRQTYLLPSDGSDATGDDALTFDIDITDGHELWLFGDTGFADFGSPEPDLDCAVTTFLFTYDVYAFAEAPADQSGLDESTGEWAGALARFPRLVVPDASTGFYETGVINLPTDTGYVVVRRTHRGIGYPGGFNTGSSTGYNLGGGGLGTDVTIPCPGGPTDPTPQIPIRLSGHVDLDGHAADYVVDQYRYDPDDWTAGYELLGTDAWTDPDHNGEAYDLDHAFDVPEGTNLLRVTVDGEWTRVFPIDLDAADEIVWDLDLTERPVWRTDGTITLHCTSGGGSPAPQVFEREYWTFPTEGDNPGLEFYDTWAEEGGVLVDTQLVVPDLDAPHAFAGFIALPGLAEPVWVTAVDRTSTTLSGGWVGTTVAPGSLSGTGWGLDHDVACP